MSLNLGRTLTPRPKSDASHAPQDAMKLEAANRLLSNVDR
jgi:hypothetical protein